MTAIAPLKIGAVSIDMEAFAIGGNAILGIRDSGKSYSATMFAEQLHERGVPFVAFDPIGVWRFLRVPGAGRTAKGFPVVVAGGEDGDLPLTVSGAPEILRAAMVNGVSLVIDLFDRKLSKADWRRIVQSCMELLLHENKQHGLRHVFLEEAPEFAPQRVGPQHGQVYDAVERLARMGGNSGLGLTLIGQRSAEINKAVLELCDSLYLHRQKGRNSIEHLDKWLKAGAVTDAKAVMETLATLPTGECWAWLAHSDQPIRLKMPAKRSFHPDRRAQRGAAAAEGKKAVDVGGFVQTMRTSLKSIEEEAKANDPKLLKAEIAELKKQLERLKKPTAPDPAVIEATRLEGVYAGQNSMALVLLERMKGLRSRIDDEIKDAEADVRATAEAPKKITVQSDRMPVFRTRPASPQEERLALPARQQQRTVQTADGITQPQQRILNALAWADSIGLTSVERPQLAFLASASPKSSAFKNNLGTLRTGGWIDYPASGGVCLTKGGRSLADAGDAITTNLQLQESIRDKVTAPQWNILAALIEAHPHSIERGELARRANASATSSAFKNNLGALRSLGLLDYPAQGQVAATSILFLEGR
jgi:hypothetical protein